MAVPNRMNVWKSSKGGLTFSSQKFMLQILGLYIGFFGRFPKKMQHSFLNMRGGGQRPFGIFPKIHSIWPILSLWPNIFQYISAKAGFVNDLHRQWESTPDLIRFIGFRYFEIKILNFPSCRLLSLIPGQLTPKIGSETVVVIFEERVQQS